MSKYEKFDTTKLSLLPLEQRSHDMHLDDVLSLDTGSGYASQDLAAVADRIATAREKGKPIILMMGAHVIKAGMSRFVIDMMERGVITHVGMNGACTIHDFELALIGGTTESVARYIQEGQFGLWDETGRINEIVNEGIKEKLGYGEAV